MDISGFWYVLIQALINVEVFTTESRYIDSTVSVRLHHHLRERIHAVLDPAAVEWSGDPVLLEPIHHCRNSSARMDTKSSLISGQLQSTASQFDNSLPTRGIVSLIYLVH